MNSLRLDNIGDFPCAVRKSKRAKYAQIKVGSRGVEVILPFRHAFHEASRLLANKKSWIEKQLSQLTPPKPLTAPPSLYLAALEEFWTIDYQLEENPPKLFSKSDQTLLIQGGLGKENIWQLLLQKWLQKKAQAFLPTLLSALSLEVQLPFNKLSIRKQRTRWGSCSSHKNINLNYQILFLPMNLAKHILLHELCHTVHMNHSKAFWTLLKEHDPNSTQHERQLKEPRLFVPGWV